MDKQFHENEVSRSARPGQYVIIDSLHRPRRVQDTLTSWAARAYRKRHDGGWDRVA